MKRTDHANTNYTDHKRMKPSYGYYKNSSNSYNSTSCYNQKSNYRYNGNHRKSNSYNSSYHSSDIDDNVGQYHGVYGDIIHERYIISKELGKGTFGTVYYCKDKKHNDHIALKIVRNIPKYVDSAKIEAKILDKVYENQKLLKCNNFMKMYSHFYYKGFYCMVCEPLAISLYELIKENDYVGLPMTYVKDISRQLLESLGYLEKMNLIHTDLKLENILFVYDSYTTSIVQWKGSERAIKLPTSTRIKIIDFGGATFDDDKDKSTIINTRQYRSPEVILEIGWSFPSDVWSAGCIIAEIYSGDLLFATHDELEHIAMIEKCLGSFPQYMLDISRISYKYYHSNGNIKFEELEKESFKYLDDIRPLNDYFTIRENDKESGIIELVEGLLRIDPKIRLSSTEALNMKYFKI